MCAPSRASSPRCASHHSRRSRNASRAADGEHPTGLPFADQVGTAAVRGGEDGEGRRRWLARARRQIRLRWSGRRTGRPMHSWSGNSCLRLLGDEFGQGIAARARAGWLPGNRTDKSKLKTLAFRGCAGWQPYRACPFGNRASPTNRTRSGPPESMRAQRASTDFRRRAEMIQPRTKRQQASLPGSRPRRRSCPGRSSRAPRCGPRGHIRVLRGRSSSGWGGPVWSPTGSSSSSRIRACVRICAEPRTIIRRAGLVVAARKISSETPLKECTTSHCSLRDLRGRPTAEEAVQKRLRIWDRQVLREATRRPARRLRAPRNFAPGWARGRSARRPTSGSW